MWATPPSSALVKRSRTQGSDFCGLPQSRRGDNVPCPFSGCGSLPPCCSRRRVSQRITSFVIGMTRVPPDMYPDHLVITGEFIHLLPEIPVCDRAAGGALPSVRLPSRKELRDATPHVFRVRQHGDLACAFQSPQSLDRRDQFHAIVRCVRRTPLKHALAFPGAQNARPASGSWVAEARTIGDNFDFAQVASGNCGHATPPFHVNFSERSRTTHGLHPTGSPRTRRRTCPAPPDRRPCRPRQRQ